MPDLADRIRERAGAWVENALSPQDCAEAVLKVLDQCTLWREGDHRCHLDGDEDCAPCCADETERVIAEALGLTEGED
jgi:hypothetical protein